MFNTLHQMFEVQYTELAAAVDEIAERIRALGVHAPGSYKAFADLTEIKEEEGVPSAEEMIANLVAGHLMLTLLLASGAIFIWNFGDAGIKSLVGVAWFAFGLGIYLFEVVVAVLQAYIFTLLSAVYIQSSVHPEH